jgi:hypothetical protein
MDSASMKRAMEELAAVKEQIAKLHETRELALLQVAKIKADVDKIDVSSSNSSSKSKEQPDYGSQQYWDERYKSDPTQSGVGVGGVGAEVMQTTSTGTSVSASTASISTSASASTSTATATQSMQSTQLYEWYLSWAEMQPLLSPDLDRIRAMPEQQQTQTQQKTQRKQQKGQREQTQREPRVLVLGCGNSSLCEDLWHFGRHLRSQATHIH